MTPLSERLRQAASYTRSDQMRELLLEAAGMIEGSDSRLYIAVDTLCAQAGADTDNTIDWLCGEGFGMAKLFEAYFSPKPPAQQPQDRKPLTNEQIASISVAVACGVGWLQMARAIEAAHGIKD